MPPKPSTESPPKTPPLSPPTSPSQRAFRLSSPPSSPPQNPTTSSRNPSVTSVGRREQYYTPYQPSNLRNSSVPEGSPTQYPHERLYDNEDEWPSEEVHRAHGESSFENDNADETTGLLGGPAKSSGAMPRRTFVRPGLHRNYDSFTSYMTDEGFGGTYHGDGESSRAGESEEIVDSGILGDAVTDGVLPGGDGSKMSTTKYLRKKHGIKGKRRMYLAYYVPLFTWMKQYKWSYLRGDLVAAITMASFYIPMALSYASNLGHIPPINGLYSFVFNPLIYAILGSCPQMVVGPEAAGSLLTGQVVRDNINRGSLPDKDGHRSAEIAGMVTFMAGGVILLAGIFRLGFLDNVLSRPFLRGFISAIGIVIFVDQLIAEMGLTHLATQVGGVTHGSCLDKVIFLIENARFAHAPTTAVSFGTFGVIMVCRELKKHLQPRYPNAAYIPDRFIIVVLSAILSWQFRWDQLGVEILGDIKTGGKPFPVHWPLEKSLLKYASDAFSTSFIIALLGFFESSVAAKSLGVGESTSSVIKNMNLSANRELMALGVANITGGLFMSLPAFGGYGRSKVNASTGGKTPMSSIFLSIITVLCVLFMTPYFYYIPRGVLCATISVVAYSLLEESPPDILFFIRIRGYSELSLMFLIFVSTIFWDIKVGIAVGIGLSVLRVIRHATRPRIQILGRVPGTTDKFENAERQLGRLEFFDGCLIVKIPEPLTFANTGDLRARLRRIEEHGTVDAHPALPPVRRKEHNQNIIFDVHGVTSLDGAGAQILMEIVRDYVNNDVRVLFCRAPKEGTDVWRLFVESGIVNMVGGPESFVGSVSEALMLVESDRRSIGTAEDEGRVV